MDLGHILPLTSAVAGRTPAADAWHEKEMAVNTADGLIFQKIDGHPLVISRLIPAPPTTGTHTLKAIEGVMQWVAD
jgi:hypothetical protein